MDGKIVIMDYSSYERQKIRHIVEKAGSFEIIEIACCNEFKLIYSTLGEIRLVITDINFPSEKEGFEILSMIRNPGHIGEIPVIIVTKTDTVEIKSAVLKLGVKDYIVRPYPVNRLESSIRSIIRLEKLFNYDTSGIENINMSFDDYISREIKYAKRTQNPLSLIIVTMLKIYDSSEGRINREIASRDRVFPIAAELARTLLRTTDTISVNKNRDIIIVLPCTGETGAAAVCSKFRERLLEKLQSLEIDQSEYIYPVHVTCPNDGEDFQALMECAFERVSVKEMLEKIASIPADTRKYANRRYNQFRMWY